MNVFEEAQRGASGEAISVNGGDVARLARQRDMGRARFFQRLGNRFRMRLIIIIRGTNYRHFGVGFLKRCGNGGGVRAASLINRAADRVQATCGVYIGGEIGARPRRYMPALG